MSTALFPQPFTSGLRLIDGLGLDSAFAYPFLSSQDSITATAGGGQTNAFQLTARINRVTVVASGTDSVKLPPANPGTLVYLTNSGANSLQLYSHGAATINDIDGAATGVAQAASSQVVYSCPVKGKWYSYGVGTGGAGNYTGNFDGVVGANTPAAATFTTVSATGDITLATGKAIKTDTTTAHTAIFQAYDVDGTAYKTFATLTNGNTPAFAIAAPSGGSVTIDGTVIGGVTAAAATVTTLTVNTSVTLADTVNIVLNATTGTKIGTATSQKLGFYNAAPVIQQATTGTTTGFTAATGTAVLAGSTFTGNSGSTAYTIGDIVLALKTLGLMAA